MKASIIIPAKNESRFIENTLRAIEPSLQIIVIDDGSSDDTASIARKYTNNVISLPNTEIRAVGRPHLAEVVNAGLKFCKDNDYICMIGADHILPPDYVSNIVNRMKQDGITLASGMINGEFVSQEFPWGSGRVIDCDFFRQIGFRYPEKIGWEDWLVYKALAAGKKVRCYTDIATHTQRPMSFRGKGEIMYALGYYWPYALGRCVRVFLRSPSSGLDMFMGFVLHKNIEQLDVAPWVNRQQRMMIKVKIFGRSSNH